MTTAQLRERLGDRLVLPGDGQYDRMRAVWNAMVDRRPRMIVRCAGADDVAAAVRLGRELGLEIGVRCGGHSVLGLSVPEDGLMIDLTPMGAVTVDPATRRARVQGGALLGALDAEAQRHGLATTAGNVSHTGVGGLTLGGGMGWLARQYGLSCDNVVSYELVTADGDQLRVTRDEHPELFWALRGGGGNFGIVTEFEFQLHATGTRAYVAELTYPLEQAAAVLRGWRDLSADAPREATFAASMGRGLATVGYVWAGPTERAADLLPRLRSLGVPVTENVGELSYLELQTREDSPEGHAYRRYWKGHYVRGLPDEAIDAMVAHGDAEMGIGLQAYGGAIADVPDDDSAFSQRDALFEYVAAARWDDAAEDAERMAVARRTAAAIAPFSSGAYVNALSDEGADGVRRAYRPAKLDRLTAVKAAYDPENVFHLNHNIVPAGS
ncbi:FAD-binding oxidoreductase [Jiangella sp. DSM 45060]|uniref:FAD-binding oxidoreductase n=1 Tax=Jiangella sp. DSM 45060 TaxID=1798224 RepID=UPI00087B0E24|nr:FAD-binding oxidoreductase [Jiangella sp. DSM 45060]SDT56713.1 FAD/FMN-containing dehydrogenase [Jiangella sp. DSM 45060]